MSELTVHSLTTKDLSTMTGECSVCGLVAIRKAGTGFQCSVKKAEGQRAWREANPQKVRDNRRHRSPHQLFDRDYLKLTAKCVRCGPVEMQPWGRGYACAIRSQQIRDGQEVGPQVPCRECWIIDGDKVWMSGGVCPRCSDRKHTDLAAALREAEDRRPTEHLQPGFSVVDLEHYDPYDMSDYDSVVPGWKTVGTERPWNEV